MIKIRGEIPQFKRCCMCLPLRHGLIVWGYIRLVIGVILFFVVTKAFFELLNEVASEVYYVIIYGFFVILGGADIVLNVIFVYAEHTKNLKMMKAYYIYSFILWIFMIIIGVALTAYAVYVMKVTQMDFIHVWIVLVDVASFLAEILIQAYVLLLVRSELVKLTTDCEFRFVNNAAESVCKLTCKEDNIAIIANGNIIVNRDVIAIKDIIANTHAIADGDKTSDIIVIGNGDEKGHVNDKKTNYGRNS